MEKTRKFGRHQIEHRTPVVGIGGGADKARRLVQQQRHRCGGVQHAIADLHHVGRFHLGRKGLAQSPVNRYLSGTDQLLTAPPGAKTRGSQKSV